MGGARKNRGYYAKPQSSGAQAQDRNCMTCGKGFRSVNNGNRMCTACRGSSRRLPAPGGWEYMMSHAKDPEE